MSTVTTEETETIATPKQGIYPGIPSADYHKWDAMSSHRLGLIAKSPLHLYWAMNGGDQVTTPAMELGEAVHYAVLEPDLFKERYALAPKCDRRTTVGKNEYAAWFAENATKIPLDADDWSVCMGIRDSVWAHLSAGPLLKAGFDPETSVVWDDNDVRCKCRTDLPTELGVLADLKTTADASFDEFERSIFNYGYYRQAAMNLDGWKANGREFEDGFVFIAVEKVPPYAVAVYRLADDVIERGRKQNAALLDTYRQCRKSGNWPGYATQIQDIRVPAWAEKRLAERL